MFFFKHYIPNDRILTVMTILKEFFISQIKKILLLQDKDEINL